MMMMITIMIMKTIITIIIIARQLDPADVHPGGPRGRQLQGGSAPAKRALSPTCT